MDRLYSVLLGPFGQAYQNLNNNAASAFPRFFRRVGHSLSGRDYTPLPDYRFSGGRWEYIPGNFVVGMTDVYISGKRVFGSLYAWEVQTPEDAEDLALLPIMESPARILYRDDSRKTMIRNRAIFDIVDDGLVPSRVLPIHNINGSVLRFLEERGFQDMIDYYQMYIRAFQSRLDMQNIRKKQIEDSKKRKKELAQRRKKESDALKEYPIVRDQIRAIRERRRVQTAVPSSSNGRSPLRDSDYKNRVAMQEHSRRMKEAATVHKDASRISRECNERMLKIYIDHLSGNGKVPEDRRNHDLDRYLEGLKRVSVSGVTSL